MSEPVKKGILALKVGMTQIFTEDGKAIAVTVVEAEPCVVLKKRTTEKDGYQAIQVGFHTVKERKLNRPDQGQFSTVNVKPRKWLKEIKVENIDEYEVGQELGVDIFSEGDMIDVTGISKGKGFQGGIKRHGFRRGPMGHGSKYHRRPGSLGAKGPARVFKGRKLPGHTGRERVTVKNLQVVKVYPEQNIMLIRGAVPGPQKSLLAIKSAARA